MNKLNLGAVALTLLTLSGGALARPLARVGPAAMTAAPSLTGDYVESRSLSVYAGACHYGGEAVTAGREAILAWRINAGAWDGQRLDGLTAVAVINGPENLALNAEGHRTLLYVDRSATPEQRDALVRLLSNRYGATLGEISSVVSSQPVGFDVSGASYRVRVPGAVYVAADKYPCNKCLMPHQTWYAPFVALQSAQVARALRTEFKAGIPSFTDWSNGEANSAYIGQFTL